MGNTGLKINPEKEILNIKKFIQSVFFKKGFKKAILGLSGGLDSTVTAYLARHALGAKAIRALILPYGKKQADDAGDAVKVAKALRINWKVIDISPMINPYFKIAHGISGVRKGNKMARERMSILFDMSKKYNSLVIGTSNKTELILGYFTIYGDGACAVEPIAGLYKTQVLQLGRYLKIPENILIKKPSAGLWPGQTDEGELGFSYKDVDRFLFYYIDKGFSVTQAIKKGFSRNFCEAVTKRIEKNKFKLSLPEMPSKVFS